ncbi:hypothetical protein PRUB_a4239 [Pseudoalteromonas rubra]|uniref:Uncharacterized protein n=1 Tax=Pseudoalteromonas rubra TaxID=43658 RepID=A0A8T0C699_9GAMM|nr:hypothetical protein PRUB_a4239 [Pseudoalteromonas rubra]
MIKVIGQPPKLMSFSSVCNALFFAIGYPSHTSLQIGAYLI